MAIEVELMRYNRNALQHYVSALFLCSDTRKAYTCAQYTDTGEVHKFTYENDLTMEKLMVMEKQMGLY